MYCLRTVARVKHKKLSTFLPFSYIYLFIPRYECEESFTTLNVDIRNHQNLLDSLEQYVKGDLLEGANAYHCEKCNKKVMLPYNIKFVYNCDATGVLSSVLVHVQGRKVIFSLLSLVFGESK